MNEEALFLRNQLCFRLYAVSRNMTRLYQPILEKFNLTYPQYIVLLAMFEENIIDFKKLSKTVDLKTGTLTPIVQKLEEMGHIKKVKNKEDGRRLDVSLTDTGRELKKELLAVPYTLTKKIDMDESLYLSMVKDLDTLLEKLQKAQEGVSHEQDI